MSNSLEPLPLLDGTFSVELDRSRKENTYGFPDQLTSDFILNYGKEAFNDAKSFSHWLAKSNRALGGLNPLELLVEGGQENLTKVVAILNRIEHGGYS
jgi:hypothetical protein